MKLYELFQGNRYILTVLPSEDPYKVLNAERSKYGRAYLVEVDTSTQKRTKLETHAPIPNLPEEDEYDFEWDDENA